MEPPPGPSFGGRRPNTIAPTNILTISSNDLYNLSDEQLIEFADAALGIVIPLGTPRTKILTRIVNTAIGARDGL